MCRFPDGDDALKSRRWRLLVALVATCLGFGGHLTRSQESLASDVPASSRCFALELYTRGHDPASVEAARTAEVFAKEHRGVSIRTYDLDDNPAAQARFDAIAKFFQIESPTVPLVYGNRQFVMGCQDEKSFVERLRGLLVMDVFVRADCPRCARGKEFLARWQKRYPALTVRLLDIVESSEALNELQQLAKRHKTAATSVPVFCVCDQLVIGFDSDETTGERLDAILRKWTFDCDPKPDSKPASGRQSRRRTRQGSRNGVAFAPFRAAAPSEVLAAGFVSSWSLQSPTMRLAAMPLDEPAATGASRASLDVEPPAPELDLPIGDAPANPESPAVPADNHETVKLPVFGRVNARELGLPLFTLAIGLVDGFNPCAMWVLLFLLSLLVNLQDRRKILAVAGTFVLISAAAYFAFMAAWLNVFRFIGMLRGVQITLACIAIVIGSIHVKDFFAFKRGVSLSIPESAKPGIYARVRSIVMAENLFAAITSAAVLAVLVNIIELLCTAGLPALYTQVLTMRGLPLWQNYSYLLLYDLAYMFDDGLMVLIVVITLNKLKMQETQGRWLKLVSGSVILAVGLVMLVKPEWLV